MLTGMITLILTGLLALRHQLAVLRRTAPRPHLRRSDRLFWVLLSRLWSGWTDAVSVVQPATVIRWQRSGFKLFWTWKSHREQARPPGRRPAGPGAHPTDVHGQPPVPVKKPIRLSRLNFPDHRHLCRSRIPSACPA
jgi:hypothetical protein